MAITTVYVLKESVIIGTKHNTYVFVFFDQALFMLSGK
jgi:hypothetical protein